MFGDSPSPPPKAKKAPAKAKAPPKAKAPAKKAPAKAKNGFDSGSEDDFDAKMDSGSDSDFKVCKDFCKNILFLPVPWVLATYFMQPYFYTGLNKNSIRLTVAA